MELLVILASIAIGICIIVACEKEESNKKVVKFKPQNKKSTRESKKNEISIYNETKSFSIKGLNFRSEEEISAARFLERGDTLILKQEPNNAVDPNAVKVLTINGHHIGYVEISLSAYISDRIEHIKYCKVSKIKRSEIPFIEAEVNISATKCRQPEIINKEFQVGAEDDMIRLTLKQSSDIFKDENKYGFAVTIIKGTYDLDQKSIDRARAMKNGESIVLKRHNQTEFIKSRVDVYSEDGVLLGFISDFMGQDFYNSIDDILKVYVCRTMEQNNNEFLSIKLIHNKLKSNRLEPFSISISCAYDGSYPQIVKAEELKNENPNAALDLAIPVAEVEKDIEAKFLCCQCYRILKDYESERIMILKIIEHINNASHKSCSPSRLHYFQVQLPIMRKRLNTVETRIANRLKRKS